jgi:hypothetical protein
MYTEKALNSLKNIWNKDEQTFIYCLDLLKNMLSNLEFYQFKFFYYLKNNNFEKAIECWYELRENIELMDDDFWNGLESYELNKAAGESCGSACGDCCNDCDSCGDCNCCSWLFFCLTIPAGCGICYECCFEWDCDSVCFSWCRDECCCC